MKVALIFEDPGAYHYCAELLPYLKKIKASTDLYLTGVARQLAILSKLTFQDLRSPQEQSYDLVVLGTSEGKSSFFDWVRFAKNKKIPSCAIVDAPINVLERFRNEEGRLEFTDYIIVPDLQSAEELKDCGLKADSLLVAVSPAYLSLFKKEIRTKKNVSPKQIVFLGENRGGLNPDQFTDVQNFSLQGSGKFKHRMDIVLEEFFSAIKSFRSEFKIILRPHPKNKDQDYQFFKSEFDSVSDDNLETLLCHSDLVVGMTTTALVEASILGIETLSIVTRPLEKKWLPTVQAGVAFSACTRAELNQALKDWSGGVTLSSPESLKNYFLKHNNSLWREFLIGLAETAS